MLGYTKGQKYEYFPKHTWARVLAHPSRAGSSSWQRPPERPWGSRAAGAAGTTGNGASASDEPLGSGPCASGQPLAGATYDIEKSRFAFGSRPVAVDAGALVRWTGSEGVVVRSGATARSPRRSTVARPRPTCPAGAATGSRSDAYVIAYFESMG